MDLSISQKDLMFHFHIIHVLFQPVAKQKYGFDDSSTDGPSMSNNLVQVNVYFDSLSEELISSNILYTVGVLIISYRCCVLTACCISRDHRL